MYSAMVSLCLGLSLSQVPNQIPADVQFLGHRDFRLPLTTAPRPEVRQLTLYLSQDRGENWQQVQVLDAKDYLKGFIFRAPIDGEYWFQVAATDQQGRQDPENIGDFRRNSKRVQKWYIHTRPPELRITSAQRQGDDIVVHWEIQDEFPDWSKFKVEYQIQPSPQWNLAQATPGHNGQVRIHPGNSSPVTVKVYCKNRAGHEEQKTADVAGAGSFQPPLTPPISVGESGPGLVPPPGNLGGSGQSGSGDAKFGFPAGYQDPPQRTAQLPPKMDPMPPLPPQPITPPVKKNWVPGYQRQDETRLIADSKADNPSISAAPAVPSHKPLPKVRYVKTKEVTLEYELTKVGPSGVGSVDLWWTRNDGQTWERYADDPEARGAGRHQRTLPLPVDDGVFGFLLVVRSRAGLGGREPRSGDVPEIRIEVDTTPPVVQLFAPVPDPQHANALILCWTAADKNLGSHPVHLEWAEQREGPWIKIAENLPNTGRHSWLLPDRLPVQVYLRVRVCDLAGNWGVATTSEPQLVDLSVPEGKLIDVTPNQR